jgi:hypothetical protein
MVLPIVDAGKLLYVDNYEEIDKVWTFTREDQLSGI